MSDLPKVSIAERVRREREASKLAKSSVKADEVIVPVDWTKSSEQIVMESVSKVAKENGWKMMISNTDSSHAMVVNKDFGLTIGFLLTLSGSVESGYLEKKFTGFYESLSFLNNQNLQSHLEDSVVGEVPSDYYDVLLAYAELADNNGWGGGGPTSRMKLDEYGQTVLDENDNEILEVMINSVSFYKDYWEMRVEFDLLENGEPGGYKDSLAIIRLNSISDIENIIKANYSALGHLISLSTTY